MVREWCGQPFDADPGTTYAYSNMGYVIAGAMLERVAGTMWEELVTQRIFVPLELHTAGFGPQASLGRTDAPLGHLVRSDRTLKPMLVGPAADNPAVLARPAPSTFRYWISRPGPLGTPVRGAEAQPWCARKH